MALLTCAAVEVHEAAAAEPVAWLVGPAFQQQLSQPVTLDWAGAPLRPAIVELARTQRVAIVLDRRVDPDQLVRLQAQQEPLDALLGRLAAELRIGHTRLDNVVYLGPVEMAGKLRTLAALVEQQVAELPPAARTAGGKVAPWRWDFLARPRDLFRALAREANIEFVDLENQVPHDLWADADLPPLAWRQRALLVAVQFDRTLQFIEQGRKVQLAPVPTEVRIERTYSPGKDIQATAARYRQLAPEAVVETAGGKIIVRGRIEDHERLTPSASTAKPPPAKGGIEVYSLKLVDVPLESLLAALEMRLGLKFQYDRAALEKAGIKLDQRVSLAVEQKPLDELLRAALEPAGLTFRRQEKVVEITIGPKRP